MSWERLNWKIHAGLLGVGAAVLAVLWMKVLLMPEDGIGQSFTAGLGLGIALIASVALTFYAMLTSAVLLLFAATRAGVVLAHVAVLSACGLIFFLAGR